MSMQLRKSAFQGTKKVWKDEVLSGTFLDWALARSPTPNEDHLRFAIALTYRLINQGYAPDAIVCLLVHLDWHQLERAIKQADYWGALLFEIPIHYKELQPVITRLWLPLAHLKFIKRWYRKRPHTGEAGKAAHVLSPEFTYKRNLKGIIKRFDHLKAELEGAHAAIWTEGPMTKRRACLPLELISQARFNLNVRRGLFVPGLFQPLMELPLPAAPSVESVDLLHALISAEPPPVDYAPLNLGFEPDERLPVEHRFSRRINSRLNDASEEKSSALVLAQSERLKEIEKAIRTLTQDPRRRITQEQKKVLDTACNAWLAEPVFTPDSVARLGLLWVCELLKAGFVNFNTASDYLRQTVRRFTLHYGEGMPLSLWDQNDVDTLFNQITKDGELAGNTIYKHSRLLRSFFWFVQRCGLLEEVCLPTVTKDYISKRFRNHILNPEQVEHWLMELSIKPQRACGYAFMMGTLGFYAGFRSIESITFSLADVQISADLLPGLSTDIGLHKTEVWLNIPYGKTSSGARKVPLHALAPPCIVKAFIQYVRKRRQEFEADADWRQIALIGNTGEFDTLEQGAVTRTVLRILRRCLGDQIDLHTLRHNAASWLLLRWRALLDQRLSQAYQSAFPSTFEPGFQQRLTDHLNFGRCTSLEAQSHHLIEIARLMGHASIDSTFDTYIHSLDVVTYLYATRGTPL